MKMSQVLWKAFKDAESFTLSEAVEIIGKYYYCNERFHVGNVMSRLVNGGAAKRIKRGVFKFLI